MKSALVQCGHLILELQLRLYADSLTQGAKDFLLLLFLNCSEVYGNRRPLDGTDADLIKLYDKTGFEQSKDSDMIRYKLQYKNRKACEIPYAFFFCKKIKKSTKIHYPFPKFPHTECIQKK